MSATNRGAVRHKDDFYQTPSWCVHRLIERLDLPVGTWLEPCAGDGAIVRAVNEKIGGIEWVTNDLRKRKGIAHNLDYLANAHGNTFRGFSVLITNPPFSLAMEFITAALANASSEATVAMLLRLNFLASETRRNFFAANGWMPDVYVLPNRPSFTDDGKTDATEYAWFVWPEDRGKWRDEGRIAVLESTPAEERLGRK